MRAEVVYDGIVPEQLLVALQRLSPDRCQQVVDFAEFLVEKRTEPVVAKPPRILGLHAGQVWMSEDFDQPFPDEFWFGENDPLMMSDEQLQTFNQATLP